MDTNARWIQAEQKIGWLDASCLYRESASSQRRDARLQRNGPFKNVPRQHVPRMISFLSVQRFLSERRREWSIVLFQLPAKRQKELVDPKLIRILFVVHKAPHISAFSRGLLDFGCLYYTMVLRFLVLFLQILYHSYACFLLIMPF